MDHSSNTVAPIHNLPNLKQGQNGVKAAFTIYGIILDIKARLPGPKEVSVSTSTSIVLVVIDVLIVASL